ncbi:MAG: chemotaxis protein CheA [Candidatus Cloacimonadales bacterium]|jgi:two-component system chemotaxis sensor kinase CheA|nr:chemotaxis protein CheA [Candidatus Cloacimonadales bacterium]
MNKDCIIEDLVNSISLEIIDIDEKDNQDLAHILIKLEKLQHSISKEDNESLFSLFKGIRDPIETLILKEIDPVDNINETISQIHSNFELLQNYIEEINNEDARSAILHKIENIPVSEDTEEVKEELILEQVDNDLFDDFLNEAKEYIDSLEVNIIELEEQPKNIEIINEIFRPFHTLKGVSSFMGLKKLNHISHETENLLDLARNKKLIVCKDVISTILIAIDYIKKIIYNLTSSNRVESVSDDEINKLIDLLKQQSCKELVTLDTSISVDELPSIDFDLECIEIQKSEANTKKTDESIRVKTDKLDFLIDTVGELVISFNLISEDKNVLKIHNHDFIKKISQLSRVVSDLQNASMALRMIPLGNTLQKMKRVVRDYTNQNKKSILLHLEGEETEIDRNIVDSLYDPLVHMIRNSCDHGIEPNEEREMLGKSYNGNITLSAYHKGNSLVIDVIDDGKGIDKDKVYKKALEKGFIKKEDNLSDDQIFKLIFHPGFSTVEQVSKVSGRGVGMDVVQEAIKSLSGNIDIISKAGIGSTFRLVFPLTLAIMEGMLIKVEEQLYIIPIGSIQRSLKPVKSQINKIFNKGETLCIEDKLLPIVRLNKKFNLSQDQKNLDQCVLIIIQAGNKEYAIAVDELLGIQNVVVKNLGEYFKNLEGVSGATIMGDGRVGIILDTNELYFEE